MVSFRVLAMNAGSSSIKAAMFDAAVGERRLFGAEVSGIDTPSGGRVRIWGEGGEPLADDLATFDDHRTAVARLMLLIQERCVDVRAVGHRLVHGGPRFREPVLVTDDVVNGIRALEAVDPDHAGGSLAGIEALKAAFPSLPHVACFDTAFHARMPKVARLLPLPRRFLDAGIVRYGFHGLSYEFVVGELRRLDPAAADGRVVIAHLGSGASMAAVHRGIGVETTMGFTPAGGLMMGTRSGDLDPGALIHVLGSFGMSVEELNQLVNRESGLLGVSGQTGDMVELLSLAKRDANAAEAIELFCYLAKKQVGAFSAVLGGLETLVFTGGIGEHSPPVRAAICAGLQYLGIELDTVENDANAAVVSPASSRVTVRTIPTDEERVIVRHTADLVRRTLR